MVLRAACCAGCRVLGAVPSAGCRVPKNVSGRTCDVVAPPMFAVVYSMPALMAGVFEPSSSNVTLSPELNATRLVPLSQFTPLPLRPAFTLMLPR